MQQRPDASTSLFGHLSVFSFCSPLTSRNEVQCDARARYPRFASVFDANPGQQIPTRFPGYRPKIGREPGAPGLIATYGHGTIAKARTFPGA